MIGQGLGAEQMYTMRSLFDHACVDALDALDARVDVHATGHDMNAPTWYSTCIACWHGKFLHDLVEFKRKKREIGTKGASFSAEFLQVFFNNSRLISSTKREDSIIWSGEERVNVS